MFYFGTKYSAPMKALVAGPDGVERPVHGGSYGVGVSRLVGAIIEAFHDDAGIKWPEPVAPFRAIILNLKQGAADTDAACEKLYGALVRRGVDVLYDDLDQRPGAKFATADLIGIPCQVLIGPKGLAEGKIEIKRRADGSRELMSPADAVERLAPCAAAAIAFCVHALVRVHEPCATMSSARSSLVCVNAFAAVEHGVKRPESCEIRARGRIAWLSRPEPAPLRPSNGCCRCAICGPGARKDFISVIAGFSFLGIMLGVATLIIVMAVMNGFRTELLDKILGLNGHLLIQPLESPLTDWEAVADRISKIPGVRLAAPIVEGQALASSPFNSAGVLVRGMRARDLVKLGSIDSNIKQGTLDGFDEGQGVAIGRRLADQLSLRAGDNVTLVAPRGAVTPMGTTPRIKSYKVAAVFEIGMSEYDSSLVYMPLTESQAYFNRAGDVTAIEVYIDNPDRVDRFKDLVTTAAAAPDLHDRLAPAQRHLLQRAAGRAQRDVPHPQPDRAGGGLQHRLRA